MGQIPGIARGKEASSDIRVEVAPNMVILILVDTSEANNLAASLLIIMAKTILQLNSMKHITGQPNVKASTLALQTTHAHFSLAQSKTIY